VREEQGTHTSGDVLARGRIINAWNNKTTRSAGQESQRFVLIVKSECGTAEQLIRDVTGGAITN
jgi:hypothetical protein